VADPFPPLPPFSMNVRWFPGISSSGEFGARLDEGGGSVEKE
jgi:hypothetical protein